MNTKEHINKFKSICIGCGVCVGMCNYISMVEDEMGAFIPKVDELKCVNCGRCIKVCPFSEHSKNEDEIGYLLYQNIEGIKYNWITGYYLNCFEGYSEKHRYNSASGGLATKFLEECLNNGIVDEVLCVGSDTGKHLYKYVFINDATDLKKHSKSAYYPVDISNAMKKIRNENKKFAVIVLPCIAKAIRLASLYDKQLKNNIKLIAALTCGGLPKKSMVEYVALKNCISINEIKKLKFRVKSEKYLNKNCSMQIITDNKTITSRFHGDDFGFVYLNRLFNHLACNCCDDIYGECADISFMDAWLKDYDKDILGTSIVITRSKIADSIMKEITMNSNYIYQVSIDRAIKSQTNVGLVYRKKKSAYYKTKLYKLLGYKVRAKRKMKVSILRRIIILIRACQELYIQSKSKSLWIKVQNREISIQDYDKIMSKIIKRNKNFLKWRKL